MKSKTSTASVSHLFVQICKQHRKKSIALLSETGIHAGQDILLYYLSLEDGQTISSLVEKMTIQYATISNMIDRMVVAGMVTKEKDVDDKRASRIYVTEKGIDAFKQVVTIWKIMETVVVKRLTEEQQIQLRNLLQIVLQNLD